ncbi:MAG: hypothetical protein ACRD6X_14210, partial [Pyrinomonadaceae bacterium]
MKRSIAKIKNTRPSFNFYFAILISLCLFVSEALFTAAQSGGDFVVSKSVIAGGGGRTAGGTFTVDGTVGQSLAGTTSTGGSFNLQSGFWAGGANAIPGVSTLFDYDGDGKTDVSVWRPSEGTWYLLLTENGGYVVQQWGLA